MNLQQRISARQPISAVEAGSYASTIFKAIVDMAMDVSGSSDNLLRDAMTMFKFLAMIEDASSAPPIIMSSIGISRWRRIVCERIETEASMCALCIVEKYRTGQCSCGATKRALMAPTNIVFSPP
jgi:hypothetical protein